MTPWEARRKTDLSCCLDSFDEQFRVWEDRVQRAPWETHYSQMHAITAMLGGLRQELRRRMETDLDDTLQVRVLSAWRVWETFRSHLGQRQEDTFRMGLNAADEIAWACRKPLAKAFADCGIDMPKEPALVYLNGSVSPVALQRNTRFSAEPVMGAALDKSSTALLDRLPVPLIGLPWHEVFHAPGMVAIAHETGHVVEADFNLTAKLDAAMAAAATAAGKAEQTADWQRWRAEIFADHFAIRHCGPAFVSMLADVLRRYPGAPAKSYPPHSVRMELCCELLDQMGLKKEAATLRDEWAQTRDPALDAAASTATTIAASMGTVPFVVSQLGDVIIASKAPQDGKGAINQMLKDLIRYDATTHARVQELAAALRGHKAPPTGTPATLAASAARTLFESEPDYFAEANASLSLCSAMLKGDDAGARRRAGRMRDGLARAGNRFARTAQDRFNAHFETGKAMASNWPKARRD